MTDDEFEADDRVRRLRALHEETGGRPNACAECSDPENGVYIGWPCPTIATLNGEKTWWNEPEENM